MHYLIKLFPWLSQLNGLELSELCKPSKAERAWLLQSQKKLHLFTVPPPMLEVPLSPQEHYKKNFYFLVVLKQPNHWRAASFNNHLWEERASFPISWSAEQCPSSFSPICTSWDLRTCASHKKQLKSECQLASSPIMVCLFSSYFITAFAFLPFSSHSNSMYICHSKHIPKFPICILKLRYSIINF